MRQESPKPATKAGAPGAGAGRRMVKAWGRAVPRPVPACCAGRPAGRGSGAAAAPPTCRAVGQSRQDGQAHGGLDAGEPHDPGHMRMAPHHGAQRAQVGRHHDERKDGRPEGGAGQAVVVVLAGVGACEGRGCQNKRGGGTEGRFETAGTCTAWHVVGGSELRPSVAITAPAHGGRSRIHACFPRWG